MSTALVTGATGLTGETLCRRLVESGDSVTAFVRPTSKFEAYVDRGVECIEVDLTDSGDVLRNFSGFDSFFHVAAADRAEYSGKSEFWRVNIQGTRAMLDTAVSAGVGRFIHRSTVGVQGEIEHPPARESYRVKPGDHYQDSQLVRVDLAKSYFEE